MSTEIIVAVIIGLIIFLTGYELGKAQGIKYGLKLGEAVTPLAMRQKSFEFGCCILCRQKVNETDKAVYKRLN